MIASSGKLGKSSCFHFSKSRQFVSNTVQLRSRHAGLKILDALVGRCGQAESVNYKSSDMRSQERQMILEAVLPQKESILQLAKQSLRDSEALVTALASQILNAVAWWP